MYSMWLDSKANVYHFLKNQGRSNIKRCCPLAFNINNKTGVTDFKIEELDMLTSHYEDEQAFLGDLLKYGETYIKESPKNNILIIYHKDNILSSSPVIYNDRLIYTKASEIRRKKKSIKEKVLLENDILLRDFVDFVKRIARNKVSRRYLLSPDSLGDDISSTDKKTLKKLVKNDIKKFLGEINGEAQYKVLEKGIKTLLIDYVSKYDLWEYRKEKNLPMVNIQEELEELENEITLYFRKDYRNLRMMVAFENKYLEVLEKSLKTDSSIQNRLLVSPLIGEVRLQKEVRNGVSDRRLLEEYYISLENPIIPTEPSFVASEEVRMLLEEGGISAVMEQLDADQLYGEYLPDTKILGIVKQKKLW